MEALLEADGEQKETKSKQKKKGKTKQGRRVSSF
jgi:hypothetical protein